MTTQIDDDLKEFFSRDIQVVVSDPEKFRRKLNIGMDAFKYLKATDNLGTFISSLTGGSAAAGATYFAWWSTLGFWGTLGLQIGFMSNPVGWVAAAGTGGTALYFLTQKLFRKAKESAVTEVPKFINSPLDVLALGICDLITPILLRVGYADSTFCDYERDKIRNYFVNEWGLDKTFVEGLINYDESKLDEFDWTMVKKTVRELEKTGDIKYETIVIELVRVADEVMRVDGKIHPHEIEEINKLRTALGLTLSDRGEISYHATPPQTKSVEPVEPVSFFQRLVQFFRNLFGFPKRK